MCWARSATNLGSVMLSRYPSAAHGNRGFSSRRTLISVDSIQSDRRAPGCDQPLPTPKISPTGSTTEQPAPRQHLATKKWARLFCPDVILGVYTPDEFEGSYGGEIDITPTQQANSTAAAGSVSFGPKSPSPEIDGVFADLLVVARKQDIEAYATAWAGLKPKQRAAIGLKCHEALKSMAATVDADFTDMSSPSGDQPQAEEAA